MMQECGLVDLRAIVTILLGSIILSLELLLVKGKTVLLGTSLGGLVSPKQWLMCFVGFSHITILYL